MAELLSQSPVIARLLNKVGQAAETDTRVLVLGETGVGKGLFAQTIHHKSTRRRQGVDPSGCADHCGD